jgi:hypothetical protein
MTSDAKHWMEVGKTFFELCKQFALAAIIVLLLVHPAAIGTALTHMGISEGDFWGLKWKKSLEKTDDALQQAIADKDKLSDQLRLANTKIEEQAQLLATLQPASPGLNAARLLVDQNRLAISNVQQNTQMAQQTLAVNSQLVASLEQRPPIQQQQIRLAPPPWAILAGSYPNEAAATAEAQQARAAGFEGARVVKNRGVFRVAVLYADRQVATDQLPAARVKLRPDSYLVSMEKWCVEPRIGPTMIECAGATEG